MAYFNMLNLGKSEVTLVVRDEFGEELFSEKITDALTIHKSLNLSQLVNGRYTIEVITKNKFFATQIDLQK